MSSTSAAAEAAVATTDVRTCVEPLGHAAERPGRSTLLVFMAVLLTTRVHCTKSVSYQPSNEALQHYLLSLLSAVIKKYASKSCVSQEQETKTGAAFRALFG